MSNIKYKDINNNNIWLPIIYDDIDAAPADIIVAKETEISDFENPNTLMYIDQKNDEWYYKFTNDIKYNINTEIPVYQNDTLNDLSQYTIFFVKNENNEYVEYSGEYTEYSPESTMEHIFFLWPSSGNAPTAIYRIEKQQYISMSGQSTGEVLNYETDIQNNYTRISNTGDSTSSSLILYGATIMPRYKKYNRAPANIVQAGNDVEEADDNALIYIDQENDEIYYNDGERIIKTSWLNVTEIDGSNFIDFSALSDDQKIIQKDPNDETKYIEYEGVLGSQISDANTLDQDKHYIPITGSTDSTSQPSLVVYFYCIEDKEYYDLEGNSISFQEAQIYSNVSTSIDTSRVPSLYTGTRQETILNQGGMQSLTHMTQEDFDAWLEEGDE